MILILYVYYEVVAIKILPGPKKSDVVCGDKLFRASTGSKERTFFYLSVFGNGLVE